MTTKYDQIALKISGIGSTHTHNVRTAGKVEFVKDTGPLRRDLRVEGFEWSSDSLRNLTKILWAAQRSHSYAVAALRLFSKMPSSQFSPDGLLGGRGYIQSVKDLRSNLSSVVESLSSLTDTIYDEVNGDHWSAISTESEDQLIEDAEKVKNNPEQFVESEFQSEEGESGFQETEYAEPEDMNPTPEDFGQPEEESDEDEEEGFTRTSASQEEWNDERIAEQVLDMVEEDEEAGSRVPSDASHQSQGLTESEMAMRTTIPSHGNFASAFNSMLSRQSKRYSSSSLPVETLPGPRVNHIGPGMTEFGWFNGPEDAPSDDPAMEGIYQYEPILEDGSRDGVTGYDNPTDGDSSVLKVSANFYSWLPGSRNEKNLGYYDRSLSDADVEWMKAHSDPDNPLKPVEKTREGTGWMWDLL